MYLKDDNLVLFNSWKNQIGILQSSVDYELVEEDFLK